MEEQLIIADDAKGLEKWLQRLYKSAERHGSKECMKVLKDFVIDDDKELIQGMMESPSIKDASKKVYKRKIEIITKDIYNGKRTLKHILLHPKEFKEKIDQYVLEDNQKHIKSPNMWKNMFYIALLGIYNHNESFQRNNFKTFEELKQIQKDVKKPIDDKYISNIPSNKQNKNFVHFDTLKDIYNGLATGSNERLLLSLYVNIPPVRSDYGNCRIYHKEPSQSQSQSQSIQGNYIVMSEKNPYIMLQEFKTSKKYGAVKIPVPKMVIKDIRDSLEIKERDYIFVSERSGKPYHTLRDGDKAFNKFANRLLSKHVKDGFTLTSFRHSYLSSIDLTKLSTKERTELGRIMGHARSTQEEYVYLVE